MRRTAPLLAGVVSLALAIADALGTPPVLTAREAAPDRIAALGEPADLEAFSLSSDGAVAAAAFPSPRRGDRSVVRFSRGAEAPREAELPGRAVALALSADGSTVYAVLRSMDRKGAVRAAELVRVDLGSARVSAGPALPPTARGLAIDGGGRLLVACRDEVRSFLLPRLESGPLFRVPGENVGIAAFHDTSVILLIRADQVALVDLSGPQGRDGLTPFDAVGVPGRLRGAGSAGTGQETLAVDENGRFWSVRVEPPAAQAADVESAPPHVETAAPDPVVVAKARTPAPPVEPPTVEAAPATAPANDPPAIAAARAGFVRGELRGEGRSAVAAVVVLGPDSILKEAARVVPDANGRWEAGPLRTGSYRILPAGERGRVLRCVPPFVTVVVGPEGAFPDAVFDVAGAY